MPRPVRLLLIEDDDDDAELLLHELKRCDFQVHCHRVRTEAELHLAAAEDDYDLVISDYRLPGFDGLGALELIRRCDPDVPFILVSGAVGEEVAAAVMRAGAQDYVLKDRLVRLGAAVARELTEAGHRRAHRQVEKLLIEAQKLEAVGTLAGGIAHDVGHLLTSVLAHARQLEDAIPPDHARRSALEGISLACERGRDLVRRLLTAGRRDAGVLTPLDLAAVISEAVSLLRSAMPPGIRLDLAVATALPTVLGDAGQLHQVLFNLATNAWHAIGEQGTLTIAADAVDLEAGEVAGLAPGRHVRLVVRDTGCGIEPAILGRIFEPFFSTKDRRTGTGLGLPVVRNIIAAHRGAVQVESAPGQGAEFRILLPAVESAQHPRPKSGPIPLGQGREVLVVDDEPLLAGLAQQLLAAEGWKVTVVHRPEEALQLVREDPARFACVLSDRQMPGMLGEILAQELELVAPRLPVVLVSGEDPQRFIGHARVVGVLGKPYTPNELARAVGWAVKGAGGPADDGPRAKPGP